MIAAARWKAWGWILPPASYTVQASSASGAAGDVMIEVYEVP